MPASTLGVGIIGVSPVRGWAATAHIPALRALPNYEIRALSAHSAEAARAAGEAFGVGAVFSDHEQLVTQADVDVVVVTVKVPHHRELVTAALAAGKAVYCEWPLGRDLDEARAMAALAAERGVHTVVGLQARQAPAIEFVQELLSDGYVGEVLSTTMVGVSVPGDVVVKANAYMLDKTNGANVLTVAAGHSLDTLNFVLGEFADLSAVSDLRRPLINIEETGDQVVKTAPDQIAVIGTLTSGATASVHVREAVAGGAGFLSEINGTDGTLRITGDAAVPEIDASVVHEQVDSPEVLDGRRDQVTATLRGGNVTVIRDRLASTCPNEVGHLFRDRGVLPEPRDVGPQVVHDDPGTAFGEKFDVWPSQHAARPSHNRDLPLQRNSFSHLPLRF